MKYKNKIILGFLVLTSLLFSGLTDVFSSSISGGTSGNNLGVSFDQFIASPPIHALQNIYVTPHGLSPEKIKSAYNLPISGGTGTIAVIVAYSNPNILGDLAVFDRTFNIPPCTLSNSCFEEHSMSDHLKSDTKWSLETALDVEWTHSIAPNAKILLVEGVSPKGVDLVKAVDYARSRPDVVAISMSWGGPEFPSEINFEGNFKQSQSSKSIRKHDLAFFAAAGDSGAGTSWPAVSPNVISVGGTKLNFLSSGKFLKETAWTGSGGGISKYEKAPDFQNGYALDRAKNMRAIPDVSYNADPSSGFSVYRGGWHVVGGTSAGSPQWAAIYSLSLSGSENLQQSSKNFENYFLQKLYQDKSSDTYSKYFRDIVSGKNGSCKYFCQARKHYDYVTGLGSPVTINF